MREETIAFQKIPPQEQNRASERLSYLYLQYVRIVQTEIGVVALHQNQETGEYHQDTIQLPVGTLSTLCLGSGTSITTAALTSCARSGCTVMFTGGGGYPEFSTITPLTNSSKWAEAQAEIVSSPTERRKVAKQFYAKQFGMEFPEGSITQMRGMEGQLMRKTYSFEAQQNKVKNFKRDVTSTDNVNIALNISNNLLYGIAASITNSLALNPALGIIHKGNVKAFLFDIADWYKKNLTIPIAFSLAHMNPEDIASETRRRVRKAIEQERVLKDIFATITTLFKPYLPNNTEDRIIGLKEDKPGHINYG